jgi:hypothetical protein
MGGFHCWNVSPLAFLWLVLGYFQQGIELRQNTAALKLQSDALHLQVEELKASVEQQKAIATVALEDHKLFKQDFLSRKRNEKVREQPAFTYAGGSPSADPSAIRHLVKIANVGRAASKISVHFSGGLVREFFGQGKHELWLPNTTFEWTIVVERLPDPTLFGILRITYRDGLSEEEYQDLRIDRDQHGRLHFSIDGRSFDSAL